MTGEAIAALDFKAFTLRQRFEIIHAEYVDVGRFVPFMREQLRFRRTAAEQHGGTHRPVAEIWERHNRAPSYAEHLVQDLERTAGLLKRLAEDYVVEGLVR